MFRAVSFALALLPATLAAQTHPLVGTWQVSFVGGMRIENGSPTPMNRTGSLAIETKGDSLIGTLTTDPAPNQATRPPLRMAAKSGAGKVSFVGRSEVTMNRNGDEQKATAVSTWSIAAKGDQLEGTVDRKLEGVDGPPLEPQPVTGKRKS